MRHCATSRKVAGSIPNGVTGNFHRHNPSGRTMSLGSTQPLKEMSTRNISWGQRWQMHRADNLMTILGHCHVIWEPQIPGNFRAPRASNEIALPFSKTKQMHQCLKFILFWSDNVHVSDGLSVHHQEFKTVHTATGIWQTDIADCLLAHW